MQNDQITLLEAGVDMLAWGKECLKEKGAGAGQRLTKLGKWWGRKPLISVQGQILGLLIPASDDLEADRAAWAALMHIDRAGLLARQRSKKDVSNASDDELLRGARLAEQAAFDLNWTVDPKRWYDVNRHLGTTGTCPVEIIRQLGVQRFGRIPTAGDSFCGGGSIPYAAVSLAGIRGYGSDLNPIACLLTDNADRLLGHPFARGLMLPVERVPAQDVTQTCDLWLTDPPYGDAVAYDEISEYFLAWVNQSMMRHYPQWNLNEAMDYRAGAAADQSFAQVMVECYRNLASRTSDQGLHTLMFGHTGSGTWTELALIMRAAGLRVTASHALPSEISGRGNMSQSTHLSSTQVMVLRPVRSSLPEVSLSEAGRLIEQQAQVEVGKVRRDQARGCAYGPLDARQAAHAAAMQIVTRYDIAGLSVDEALTSGRSELHDLVKRAGASL